MAPDCPSSSRTPRSSTASRSPTPDECDDTVYVGAPELPDGLLRHETGQHGPLTGALFETLVVSELHKWTRTMAPDCRLRFYRTRSGMEGLLGIEVKARSSVARRDTRGLRALGEALGERWRGGLVVTLGGAIEPIPHAPRLWQVPLHRLV